MLRVVIRRAVIVAMLVAVGCGGGGPIMTVDQDGGPAGKLHLRWTLEKDGTPTTCEAVGAEYVNIELVPAGEPPDAGAHRIVDLICKDGEGVTVSIAPGTYDLVVSLGDAFARSRSTPVAIPHVKVTAGLVATVPDITFEAMVPSGRANLSWTFLHGGQPATCEDLGVTTIMIGIPSGTLTFGTFPCGVGMGLSGTLPLSNVALQITASDAQGAPVVTAFTTAQFSVSVTQLDLPIVFEVIDEPELQLARMVDGAADWYRAHHGFPRSTGPTPPAESCCLGTAAGVCQAEPEKFAGNRTWDALGFTLTTRHRFVYSFVRDGDTFTARAEGDRDCDGVPSIYTITGHGKLDGTIDVGPLVVSGHGE